MRRDSQKTKTIRLKRPGIFRGFWFGIILAGMLVWPAMLQAGEFNDIIYRAYISGDIDSWEKSLKTIRAESLKIDERYDFAIAHYGFIGYCLSRDEKQRARPFLENVEVITENLLKIEPDNPRFIALRGALYGFRISYQPQKAPFIGPKALKKVNLALEKGPDCPQAWIEAGNKDYWMPEIFGGSKVTAMAEYEKAIRMMETDPEFIKQNWYYLNVNMILASWYEERGRTFAANEIYRKVILFEPEFSWAREKLAK